MNKNKYAEEIINFLSGYGGFDHWWDYIDEDVQQELLEDLNDFIIELINRKQEK